MHNYILSSQVLFVFEHGRRTEKERKAAEVSQN